MFCLEDSFLLNQLFQEFPYPMQLYSPQGLLKQVNTSFLKEFKIPFSSLIVDKYNILEDTTLEGYGVKEEVIKAFNGHKASVIGVSAPVHIIKNWFRLSSGKSELYVLDIHSIPLFDNQNKLVGVIIMYITQQKFIEREEINRGKQYILEHWQEKFDIDAVASAALLSKSHFTRQFRCFTGMSPHDYYIKVKIDKLKIQLTHLNLSIEQRFLNCGMQYHGHYAKLFKEETGLTPSEYRKLLEQKLYNK